MRELSLFTGAGGGLQGTKLLGWSHIGYVEHDKHCQRVIAQRIKDGLLDHAPIFTDIRQFIESGSAKEYKGFADVVTAGFPCQSFSIAGRKKGEADERNMWPETIEVIRQVQPAYCLLENVPGLLTTGSEGVEDETGRSLCGYFGTILRELSECGFDATWCVLGADEVGAASHKRKRLWIHATNTAQK